MKIVTGDSGLVTRNDVQFRDIQPQATSDELQTNG